MIRDYPLEWPRKLDFLPLLGLQTAVDENLELFYCGAKATVQEGKLPRREIRTEYGTIKADPVTRNTIVYEKGIPDPRNGIEPVPQRELLNDITENLPIVLLPGTETPDVVIGERGVVERIPREVENLEPFQGSEYVFGYQTARGNLYHRVRRALGIHGLANPYNIIKSKLLYYDIIKSPRPIQLKIRSTLKTRYVCTDAVGWSDIGPDNLLRLELALSKDKWWADIGIPTPFQIPVNSGIRGQIYQLLREKRLVVI
jgi:hypothetical protein